MSRPRFAGRFFRALQRPGGARWIGIPGVAIALSLTTLPGRAACDACGTFSAGGSWGVVAINPLQEASGLAAGRRNPGVLWTHNDGSDQNLHALGTNGVRLATVDLDHQVEDLEDMAAGPGPVAGVSYLYLGDIGGSARPGDVRASVKLLRFPEPFVSSEWATDPQSFAADGVEVFTLNYPDGAFDAEALLVDPVSGDVLIVTKQAGSARWYRANLNGLDSGATTTLQFVRAVAFGAASGGDLSADGAQIILRREDFAWLWERCDGEPIETALSRNGQSIPVLGPPIEPNGEAIALLPDGTGYVTLSEGANPSIHFHQAQCPSATRFTLAPQDQSTFAGGTAQFRAHAVGYPPPVYEWRFAGQVLAHQTEATLVLDGVTTGATGTYEVRAINAHGAASASATLLVRPKPDLRITEVMSSPAGSPAARADWWELTSFELQPVSLAGWRFNDSAGDLADAYVLPAGLNIAPRETIVLVENLTPAEFKAWWGTENVRENVQIVPYSGSGLSFSATGDQLTLWDATTSDANSYIARAAFGPAANGVSFNYDPVNQVFGALSRTGVLGAFQAAGSPDIGSPGEILPPLVNPILAGRIVGDQMIIEFQAAALRVYRLEALLNPATGNWEFTGHVIEAVHGGTRQFQHDLKRPQRYFRVVAE